MRRGERDMKRQKGGRDEKREQGDKRTGFKRERNRKRRQMRGGEEKMRGGIL